MCKNTETTVLSLWVQQLFTKEDPFQVHKTLGVLVLLSFAWRLLQIGEGDMGFATRPEWTIPTLLLHFYLNLSSFEFHIPSRRIREGSRIWPEYRLHALCFGMRSLAAIAVNWVEQYHELEPHYALNWMIVILTMVAADICSYAVGDNHSNSVRDLSAPAIVHYYFSCMQFFATAVILCGWRRSSMMFYVLFVTQLNPFLMTLRRKNLLSHYSVVLLYGAMLAFGFWTGWNEIDRYHRPTGSLLFLVGSTSAFWRMGPWPKWVPRNKYLIWTAMHMLLNHLRPIFEQQYAGGSGDAVSIMSRKQYQTFANYEFFVVVLYGVYKQLKISQRSDATTASAKKDP